MFPPKLRAALAATLAVSAIAAAVVVAQSAPPTVNVSIAGGGKFTVTGGDALKGGPTRFVYKNATSKDRSAVVVLLKPGVTVEKFTAEAKKVKDDPTRLYKLATFEMALDLGPKGSHQTTVTLKEGTYVIFDTTNKPLQGPVLNVGAGPNGASAPTPDATIRMKDFAFSMPSTLDRSGTFRFRNSGASPHFAAALQLKKGAKARDVIDGLKKGDDSVEKQFAGFSEPLGLVSPGTTNDVRFKFKRGRYVMVCFFGDKKSKGKEHSQLGMERAFTVK